MVINSTAFCHAFVSSDAKLNFTRVVYTSWPASNCARYAVRNRAVPRSRPEKKKKKKKISARLVSPDIRPTSSTIAQHCPRIPSVIASRVDLLARSSITEASQLVCRLSHCCTISLKVSFFVKIRDLFFKRILCFLQYHRRFIYLNYSKSLSVPTVSFESPFKILRKFEF